MITIYHNPRCSKSREAVRILEQAGKTFEIKKYMDLHKLTQNQLQEIIDKLDVEPIELVRKNEKIWRDNYSSKELDDDELILLMIEEPRLMERPIVVRGNKAVVGRPPQKVEELIADSVGN